MMILELNYIILFWWTHAMKKTSKPIKKGSTTSMNAVNNKKKKPIQQPIVQKPKNGKINGG